MKLGRERYYDENTFTNTYYALYIALERWMSKEVFKEDISRVFLASPDYAFRRRFELTDTTTSFDKMKVASLNFPFANYWPLNSGWKPTKRLGVNSASFVEVGISARSGILKAMMVDTDIESIFYFDREDDARQAYEILLWQSYRERNYSTTVSWKEELLSIPLSIKINNLEFNPEYNEKDWLESNRIFTIKSTINLRSFTLAPKKQRPFDNSYEIEEDMKYTLTEEVLLMLEEEKKVYSALHVKSLLDYNPQLPINYLRVVNITDYGATLEWEIDAELDRIIIEYDGNKIERDGEDKACNLLELNKGSSYNVTVTFISDLGVSKVTSLNFTTTGSASEKNNEIVGTNW